MRCCAWFCCVVALAVLGWSVAPGTSVAMDRGAVMGSFDNARGSGSRGSGSRGFGSRGVGRLASGFGGSPADPGPGLGGERRATALDRVTSIYERLGLDVDLRRPRRPSPH